jgi:hypothetical protein
MSSSSSSSCASSSSSSYSSSSSTYSSSSESDSESSSSSSSSSRSSRRCRNASRLRTSRQLNCSRSSRSPSRSRSRSPSRSCSRSRSRSPSRSSCSDSSISSDLLSTESYRASFVPPVYSYPQFSANYDVHVSQSAPTLVLYSAKTHTPILSIHVFIHDCETIPWLVEDDRVNDETATYRLLTKEDIHASQTTICVFNMTSTDSFVIGQDGDLVVPGQKLDKWHWFSAPPGGDLPFTELMFFVKHPCTAFIDRLFNEGLYWKPCWVICGPKPPHAFPIVPQREEPPYAIRTTIGEYEICGDLFIPTLRLTSIDTEPSLSVFPLPPVDDKFCRDALRRYLLENFTSAPPDKKETVRLICDQGHVTKRHPYKTADMYRSLHRQCYVCNHPITSQFYQT